MAFVCAVGYSCIPVCHWNIYLLLARTVPHALVIRFYLCVPLYLGLACHSYFVIFVGFHYYYFAFHAFIVLPTLLLFFLNHRLSKSSFLQSLFIDQLLLHFNLLNSFLSPPFSSSCISLFHLSLLVAFLSLLTSTLLLFYILISLFQPNLKSYFLILKLFSYLSYFIYFISSHWVIYSFILPSVHIDVSFTFPLLYFIHTYLRSMLYDPVSKQ